MNQGKKIPKSLWYDKFLPALKETIGNITQTCRICGVTPQSYYNYRYVDKKFNKMAQDIMDTICIPHLEDMVLSLARQGDTKMIKFFLRNRTTRRWNQDSAAYALIEQKIREDEQQKKLEMEQRVPSRAEMVAAKAYRRVLEEERVKDNEVKRKEEMEMWEERIKEYKKNLREEKKKKGK